MPQRLQLLISRLRSDLSLTFHRTGLGTSLGRDFVMRLGERRVELLRLGPDGYLSQGVDVESCYRPAVEPRIGFYPAKLWSEEKSQWEQPVKISESDADEAGGKQEVIHDEAWGSVPFAPRVELIPEPISFKEFLAWAPEAKFEWWDDRPQICGREGTRNTLGILLMTFGLNEAVRLCHPREWVEALGRQREG